MGGPSYYYTAFDRQDSDGNPEYEKFFGVMDVQGTPKFDLPAGGWC